jgi:hypothetical protein
MPLVPLLLSEEVLSRNLTTWPTFGILGELLVKDRSIPYFVTYKAGPSFGAA